MSVFHGFQSDQDDFTPLPAQFFNELLAEIDHLGELKVTLYAFWQMEHQEGPFHWLERADFSADTVFMSGLAAAPAQAEIVLDEALERAVQRGSLLQVIIASAAKQSGTARQTGKAKAKPSSTPVIASAAQQSGATNQPPLVIASAAKQSSEAQTYYFLNTPRGRAALEAWQRGRWQPDPAHSAPTLQAERPNIYTLYEQNIGPLTPLLADTLRDAEETYPADWLADAVRLAVQKNVRNWRYIEAILRSWKEKGRHEQNRRDATQTGKQYRSDEFADFIDN